MVLCIAKMRPDHSACAQQHVVAQLAGGSGKIDTEAGKQLQWGIMVQLQPCKGICC